METILEFDKNLLIFFNSFGSNQFDQFWLIITNKYTHIPLYFFLLITLFKKLKKQFNLSKKNLLKLYLIYVSSVIFLIFISLQNNSYAGEILPIREGDNSSKIKLIIYESLTCSHCANFHNEVYPELKKEFIDTGLASIEFRNFPLDLAALNASKLAHCKNNGSSELLHFLYKNQTRWVKGNNIIDLNNNLKKIMNESGIT